MEIYEVLKKDHEKVSGLLAKLVKASEKDDDHWKEILAQIACELIPHARAEEAVLYNSMREIDKTQVEAMHGFKEHIEAETILRSLQAMKAIDVNWTAAAKKLQEAVEHHVEEEEKEIFSKAKKLFTAEEAVSLGKAFKSMKKAVAEESMVETTLDLVANLMPPRFFKSVQKFSLSEKR